MRSSDIQTRFRMQTINTSDSNKKYLTRDIHSSGTLTAQPQKRGASHTPRYRLGKERWCWGYSAALKIRGIQPSPFPGFLPALHCGTQDALCEVTVALRTKEVYSRDIIPSLLGTNTVPTQPTISSSSKINKAFIVAKTCKLNALINIKLNTFYLVSLIFLLCKTYIVNSF